MVTLHPGNIIKKSGRDICLYEADGLRVAEAAGLPVPHVYGTETTPDGRNRIAMSHIEGQTLSNVWARLSAEDKRPWPGNCVTFWQRCDPFRRPRGIYRGM